MAQDEDLKAHMVKALEMATDCLVQAKLRAGGITAAHVGGDPDTTAIALLAVEIFKHMDAPTRGKPSVKPVGS